MANLATATSLERPLPGYLVANAAGTTADDLCDALLDHMLDCSTCLDGTESCCPTWQKLQSEIKVAGKPQRGMLLAL